MGAAKSPGQLAYEEDVRRQPTQPWDGKPRQTWDEISDEARGTWERNPTARDWSAG